MYVCRRRRRPIPIRVLLKLIYVCDSKKASFVCLTLRHGSMKKRNCSHNWKNCSKISRIDIRNSKIGPHCAEWRIQTVFVLNLPIVCTRCIENWMQWTTLDSHTECLLFLIFKCFYITNWWHQSLGWPKYKCTMFNSPNRMPIVGRLYREITTKLWHNVCILMLLCKQIHVITQPKKNGE